MKVGEYCNRNVVMMNGDDSVKTAAELMRKHHVGDIVLVSRRDGRCFPIGIVTDRDLVLEVMATGLDAKSITVIDIITQPVLLAHEHDSLYESLELMRDKGIRRLPVVDEDNALVGMITLDDITEILTEMLHHSVGIVEHQQKHELKQRS